MTFTKTKPTEGGYYWHLISENDLEPCIVEKVGGSIDFMGTDDSASLSSLGGLWSERIIIPEVQTQ